MVKCLRGYKAVAVLQILVSLGFFANPVFGQYGPAYGIINFMGAGVLLAGSALSCFKLSRWALELMICAMIALTCFNTIWFLLHGAFLSTGFPLIAYNILFVLTTFHYLIRGNKNGT